MADFSIPWQPLDISQGASFLLGALQRKHQLETADRQAAVQEQYAKNAAEKLSAAAQREKMKFDMEQTDRLAKATAAAEALEDAGDLHGAERLRSLHGIKAAPVMGAPVQKPPTVVTPLQALSGSQLKQPESLTQQSPSLPRLTPMQALAGTPRGNTVPEEPQTQEVQAPEVTIEDSTAEQMPLTIPGDVTPGAPTGAMRLTGPRGEDLGISDPNARMAAKQARADRVSKVLSPISPELAAMASLDTMGDISSKDYATTMRGYTAAQSEQGRNTRAQNAIDARQSKQDDQQAFLQGENEKYRDTPDRRDKRAFGVAAINARGRQAAAGNNPVPAASELARMAEHNASDEEMQKFAAEHGIGPNDYKKIVDPAARRTESHAKLLVKDVLDGKQYEAINQQAANDIGKMGPNIKQLVERTQKYIDHVKKYGPRVPPGSREDTMRRSLAKSAAVAGRTFHQLGVAMGWLHAEEDILGPSGSSDSMMGWLLGARPDVIRNQLEEAKIKYRAAVEARTRPAEMSGQAYQGKPDEKKEDDLESMVRALAGGK